MNLPAGGPAGAAQAAAQNLAGSAQAAGGPVKQVAAGAATATPKPPPAPIPAGAPRTVPTPQIAAGSDGKVGAGAGQQVAAAVNQLPTSDPALNQTVGAPPPLVLEGNADPARVQEQRAHLDQTVVETQAAGARAAAPLGEDHIYPDNPAETLKAEIGPAPGGGGGAAHGGAGGAGAGGAGGEDAVSIVAQQERGGQIQAAVAQGQAAMAAKKQEHTAHMAQEQAASQVAIDQVVQTNAAEQNSSAPTRRPTCRNCAQIGTKSSATWSPSRAPRPRRRCARRRPRCRPSRRAPRPRPRSTSRRATRDRHHPPERRARSRGQARGRPEPVERRFLRLGRRQSLLVLRRDQERHHQPLRVGAQGDYGSDQQGARSGDGASWIGRSRLSSAWSRQRPRC